MNREWWSQYVGHVVTGADERYLLAPLLGADSDEGNRVFRSDVDKDQSSAKLAISLLMDYRHESREDSGQVVLFRFHCGS